MAVNFSVPSSPARSVVQINQFLGVDYTNSPANVDIEKSPNGQNMIRMCRESQKMHGLPYNPEL